MSMCRIFSCVVGRGCLLWPMCSLGKTLLAFALLHSYSKAQFACYSRYFACINFLFKKKIDKWLPQEQKHSHKSGSGFPKISEVTIFDSCQIKVFNILHYDTPQYRYIFFNHMQLVDILKISIFEIQKAKQHQVKHTFHLHQFSSVFQKDPQFSSVTQSCPTVWDPRNRRSPGFPVHHQFPESTKTHVHWVGDAIQPSYPLLSNSPPALNLSQ